MRLSLAIECLAGVALADKTRNNHPLRTQDVRPLAPYGECATNYYSYFISGNDTACNDAWLAWDTWCW